MYSDGPENMNVNMRLTFALEGFRLIRERPKLLLFWGGVCLFGYGICVLLVAAIGGPYLAEMLALSKVSPNMAPNMAPKMTPDEMTRAAQLVGHALTGVAVAAPVYLLTSTILMCAICRAGLGGEDDRLGYLSFGLQELRVLAVQSATLFLSLALFWAVTNAWVLLVPVQQFLAIGGFIAFAAVAWLHLRLSLNVVQSFATRRIDIFGSFALTRGRSLALLGGYLLAFGLSVVVSYLCDAIIDGATMLAFGKQQIALPLNLTSLETFLTPARVVVLALWLGLVWPQTTAIVHAAPVAAYRELTAGWKS